MARRRHLADPRTVIRGIDARGQPAQVLAADVRAAVAAGPPALRDVAAVGEEAAVFVLEAAGVGPVGVACGGGS